LGALAGGRGGGPGVHHGPALPLRRPKRPAAPPARPRAGPCRRWPPHRGARTPPCPRLACPPPPRACSAPCRAGARPARRPPPAPGPPGGPGRPAASPGGERPGRLRQPDPALDAVALVGGPPGPAAGAGLLPEIRGAVPPRHLGSGPALADGVLELVPA